MSREGALGEQVPAHEASPADQARPGPDRRACSAASAALVLLCGSGHGTGFPENSSLEDKRHKKGRGSNAPACGTSGDRRGTTRPPAATASPAVRRPRLSQRATVIWTMSNRHARPRLRRRTSTPCSGRRTRGGRRARQPTEPLRDSQSSREPLSVDGWRKGRWIPPRRPLPQRRDHYALQVGDGLTRARISCFAPRWSEAAGSVGAQPALARTKLRVPVSGAWSRAPSRAG